MSWDELMFDGWGHDERVASAFCSSTVSLALLRKVHCITGSFLGRNMQA